MQNPPNSACPVAGSEAKTTPLRNPTSGGKSQAVVSLPCLEMGQRCDFGSKMEVCAKLEGAQGREAVS